MSHEPILKSDFSFDLPQALIAQTPLADRDASRLLYLDKETGAVSHHVFRDLVSLLRPGDCLILNDSKVLPARIYGTKTDTGAQVEFLLLKQVAADTWEALAGPGKKARTGAQFHFSGAALSCEVVDVLENGNRLLRFAFSGNFFEILDHIGQMPLPPYIKETLKEQERYQTVYAKEAGSAAAPTAGLHFTPALLETLHEAGIKTGMVTLHVGLGTFRPVSTTHITDHKMHEEHFELPPETAKLIRETKQRGGRVIAVGTTSCRTIESVMQKEGEMRASSGVTDIFIYPGYAFQGIDGLITNFHLPESTLIMLISALAGREHVLAAYEEAIAQRYRFFSFGDAMLIL